MGKFRSLWISALIFVVLEFILVLMISNLIFKKTIESLKKEKEILKDEHNIQEAKYMEKLMTFNDKIHQLEEMNRRLGLHHLNATSATLINDKTFTMISDVYCSSVSHTFIPFLWHTVHSEEAAIFKEKNLWSEYKNGFAKGNNLWLGLEKLHQLTKSGSWYLVAKFKWWKYGYNAKANDEDDPKTGQWAVGVWPNFVVQNESLSYRWSYGQLLLGLNFHRNSTCDVLGFSRNMSFSTADADNDRWDGVNCASTYGAGWWYADCFATQPVAPDHVWVEEGFASDVKCELDDEGFTPSQFMFAIFRA